MKKETWQMTKAEYEKEFGKPKKNTTVTGGFSQHKNAVETALNQGKKVPAEVLKDYPELKENLGEKMTLATRYIAITEGKVNEDLPIKLQTALDKLDKKPTAQKAEMAVACLRGLINVMATSTAGIKMLKEFAPKAYEIVVRGGAEDNFDFIQDDDIIGGSKGKDIKKAVGDLLGGSDKKAKDFIEYFRSFYDPKNKDVLYPDMIKKGWTDQDIIDGINKRGKDFEGDSMDRELIRDMLIAKYGSNE